MNFKDYIQFDENSPEYLSSVNMIKSLNQLPKEQSWKGYPTWDFGNGVMISLSNEDRNIDTDNISHIQRGHPENIWYIENIHSSNPSMGYGTEALEKLLSLADQNNIILRLLPKATSKGDSLLDNNELKSWYSNFGFRTISSLYYERKPN